MDFSSINWLAVVASVLASMIIGSVWFGPKGFASVIYGIFVLESHIPNARHLAHLIAIVVIGSMIAHSSTDVVIAQWFRRRQSKTPVP